MCLSPIDIINPNKYISYKYRDRYIVQVPCGHCAECQQTMSNQWFYRTWYEWQDCISSNGYVYFDTLTYDDAHLPYMSDIISDLPHIPCFRPEDIRKFTQNLRDRLKTVGASYRYFIVSEYGSLYHRPHYHLLLFVRDIDPLELSRKIDDIWYHGRTDGITYKGAAYVKRHNIKAGDLATQLMVCNYVTKYVQKSCMYDDTIEKNLNRAMQIISSKLSPDDDNFITSPHGRRIRAQLKRHMQQRHWQSQQFGASALADMDLSQIFRDGCVFMPSPKGVKIPIPLPTYYKRKLFQEQIEVHGARHWQLNELGRQYNEARRPKLVKDLSDKLKALGYQYQIDLNPIEIANYIYSFRGRIIADHPESTLTERLNSVDVYNYSTMTDKEHVGTGLSPLFVGNSHIGYKHSLNTFGYIRFRDFIAEKVYFNQDYEKILSLIYQKMAIVNDGKQKAYRLKQRLTDLFKKR